MDENSELKNQPIKSQGPKTVKPSKYEFSEAIHTNKNYWKKVFEELNLTPKASMTANDSRHLSNILPNYLYERVCESLEMPIFVGNHDSTTNVEEKKPRRTIKEPLLSYRKALFIDREMDSDTDVEVDTSDSEETTNIHLELLKKPEREQITWNTHYLQPEKEEEKSLVRKADDLTNRIAQEFCQYMKELGGDQQSQLFTPKAIKELFQIEFDTHVARSLRVLPKEMPCVEEKVAIATGNPEKSRLAFLEREVQRDVDMERRPDRVTAFGRSLPTKEQWRAPRNNTEALWRSARHVPKDLVTLKAVWEGITNLRSVKEYCRWMIDHPQYRRAPYLSSLGMFDPAVLDARLTFELQNINEPQLSDDQEADPINEPIENIRRRLSELAEN